MHKQHCPAGESAARPPLRRLGAVLAVAAAVLLAGCVPREHDAGSLARLPVGEPVFKEYKGANLYLLRDAAGAVTVFWGISPLAPAERGGVQCFIQDRRDQTFRGETRPFIDPCRGGWWSRDGRFLGYSTDAAGAWSAGPDLIRIPAEVRGGRVELDEKILRCLQSRRSGCLPASRFR